MSWWPLTPTSITRRRFAAQTVDGDGIVSPGAATDSTVTAEKPQPTPGKLRELLAEGDRTAESIRIATGSADDFRTADQYQQLPADRVVWDGKTWEVRLVRGPWGVLPHYDVVAVRVDES